MLLVLMACAPLVGLTVHSASQERRRELAAWRERARQLVETARREEGDLVAQTRQLLLAASESSAVRSGGPEACRESLGQVFASNPGYVNLALIDTNGDVMASALPLVEVCSPRDRALIRRVQNSHGFAIGNYLTGLSEGKPALTFGCPVFDPVGRARAALVAWVGLEWFTRPGTPLATDVPQGASWMVVSSSGNVLLRYPGPWPPSGQPFPRRKLLRRGFTSPERIAEAQDAHGVLSFYAFEPMASQLLRGSAMTILGIPRTTLFAEGNQALVRNLCWIGVVAGLALTLGWLGGTVLVVRPVNTLVAASARLAAGDFSTRTGLRHGKDELGQLTRTFDQMAQSLEQRDLERRRVEETLQTRDTMMRELPLVPAAVYFCDQFGVLQLYNRTAVELWGGDPADGQAGRRFCGSYQLLYPDGAPMRQEDSPTAQVLRTGAPLRNREIVIARSDGTRVPVRANVVPLRDAEGSLIGVVGCLEDITDRKQAEAKLQESNEKLQLLSRRLVESQETERRHIARELHDEVGQTLTVAEMNLQAAVQSAPVAPVARYLKQSLEAVERVLEQVRDLSLNLRPSMLDDLGLASAVRWYTNRQADLTGLKAHFHADGLEDRLDQVIETACFRVAQEALTNVARHAHARAISVALRRQNGHLHLFVRDNGVGFDVGAVRRQATQGASLGLLSMEERATLVDGALELKSIPGEGTEVHAWFPLKWRAPHP